MSDDLLTKIFTFYAAVVIHPKVWEYLQRHHSKLGENSPITYGKFQSAAFRKLNESLILELFRMVENKSNSSNGIFDFYYFDFFDISDFLSSFSVKQIDVI